MVIKQKWKCQRYKSNNFSMMIKQKLKDKEYLYLFFAVI